MKLMKLILLVTFVFSCKPEQKATDFNVLLDVPVGEDIHFQIKEDEVLEFDYYVEENKDSVDLKLAISGTPSHGSLDSCETVQSNKFHCIYRPDKNYFGSDSIQFITQDGDLKSNKSSTVSISIINVPDAPEALDKSFTVGSKVTLLITLPEGIDPDSLSSELSYNIVNFPEHGTLSDCQGRTCKYLSDSLYDGQDKFTYQVVDSTGLKSNLGTITIYVNAVTYSTSETFNSEVDSLKGADIVWVVDNSRSMEDEQTTLQNNFNSFISNFLIDGKAKFAFNMAVTTTDVYKKDIANPFSVDSNQNQYDLSSTKAEADFSSFREDFIRAVGVGTDGSGTEKSLDSIHTAYNKLPSWYAGNDSLLVYIILSDEYEQSSSHTIQEHYNLLTQLKDKKEKVLFYPIINLNQDFENRYAQLAKLSGTQVYNIKDPFQNILDQISLSVSASIKSYTLNRSVNIIPSSIKVKVNGVETSDFQFNENNYSITINNLPQDVNSQIVVSYNYGAL